MNVDLLQTTEAIFNKNVGPDFVADGCRHPHEYFFDVDALRQYEYEIGFRTLTDNSDDFQVQKGRYQILHFAPSFHAKNAVGISTEKTI